MNYVAPSTRKLIKLARTALEKKRIQEAVNLLREVLALNPSQTEALHLMGWILHSAGNYPEAVQFYERAILSDSTHLDSYHMLCAVFQMQNRGDEAIQMAHRATQAVPDSDSAHGTMVTQLMHFNQVHVVPAYIEQILPRFPTSSLLLKFYAFALKVNDRVEEAEIIYKKLLRDGAVPAHFRFLYECYLPRINRSVEEIDSVRATFQASLERFLKQKPRISLDILIYQPLFQLAYHNRDNKVLTQLYAKTLRAVAPELNYTAAHCHAKLVKPAQQPIRIGFVSRHMHNHSVGNCYRGVMLHLAAQPDFEVTFFNLANVMDGGIQQIIDANIPIISLPKALDAAQKGIASYHLDILIYPDIGMDATTHYLAMGRLAPYQCCFQGHPETTGIDTIDYVISSRSYEPPHADENYTERLLCTDGIDTIFNRPTPPERWLTREELGLPVDKKLYICPMAIQKFHPDFDGILADILARDSNAVVVLFSDFQERTTSEILKARILTQCAAERVIFMPWVPVDVLFSVMKISDALLDTVYFGGGTTIQFAFAFGVPVVTMPGRYARGRVVHSYYSLMGITDAPMAHDTTEYARIAVRLANDTAYHKALSDAILAKNDTMFAQESYAPHIAQMMKDILDQNLDSYRR
jgi:protein O-GlcNAc transferase